MPDKRYKPGCGRECLRCWRNRLKHGNRNIKLSRGQLPEIEGFEEELPMYPGPPQMFKGAHGYIQWRRIAPTTAFIMDIAVRVQHQRKGFGSKLLQRFCEQCKRDGFRKIELDNCTDHEFFQRNGFRFRQEGDNAMILIVHKTV